MPASAVVLSILGPLTVAAAWIAIRRGRGSVWTVMVPVLVLGGVASLFTGVVPAARDTDNLEPLTLIGALVGLGLYLATRMFMALAWRWQRLREATAELYGNERSVSVSGAFILGALLGSPAEELLWRGVIFSVLLERAEVWSPTWASWIAAALVWVLYVLANAFSGSVPIVLAAIVSGGVWTALGMTGVAAPIVCHVIWTGLMILFPPHVSTS